MFVFVFHRALKTYGIRIWTLTWDRGGYNSVKRYRLTQNHVQIDSHWLSIPHQHWCVFTVKINHLLQILCLMDRASSWQLNKERDQLDVTCSIISLFNAQHVSDVNTSILRNLRLICWAISWVVLLWYDVCWCYVVVWLHPDTTPPQQNHNVTPTHIIPELFNTWNKSTNKSQATEDGCINIRNVLSIK